MSVGASETYANALKAFRRGCHQFPHVWRAVVVCNSAHQANAAYDEAARMLDGGSLPVEHFNKGGMQIRVGKGGEIRFITTDAHFCDRIRGAEFPHVIVLGGLSDQMAACLRTRNRHQFVDQKYCRWDNAYA